VVAAAVEIRQLLRRPSGLAFDASAGERRLGLGSGVSGNTDAIYGRRLWRRRRRGRKEFGEGCGNG
jgi:hypothetical protein